MLVSLLADEEARAAMRTAENPYGDGRAAERIMAEIAARAAEVPTG